MTTTSQALPTQEVGSHTPAQQGSSAQASVPQIADASAQVGTAPATPGAVTVAGEQVRVVSNVKVIGSPATEEVTAAILEEAALPRTPYIPIVPGLSCLLISNFSRTTPAPEGTGVYMNPTHEASALQMAYQAGYKICFIMHPSGMYKYTVLNPGRDGMVRYVCKKVDSVNNLKFAEVREDTRFLPDGLIPTRLFHEILAFYKKVYQVYKAEAAAMILWNPEKGYHIHIPEQKVAGASAEYSRVTPAGCILVVDTHSHAAMSEFFSGTDNNDDTGCVKISGVVGNNQGQQRWKFRFCDGTAQFKDIADLGTIFGDNPVNVEVPSEWMSRVEEKKYTGYQGGTYTGYSGYQRHGGFTGSTSAGQQQHPQHGRTGVSNEEVISRTQPASKEGGGSVGGAGFSSVQSQQGMHAGQARLTSTTGNSRGGTNAGGGQGGTEAGGPVPYVSFRQTLLKYGIRDLKSITDRVLESMEREDAVFVEKFLRQSTVTRENTLVSQEYLDGAHEVGESTLQTFMDNVSVEAGGRRGKREKIGRGRNRSHDLEEGQGGRLGKGGTAEESQTSAVTTLPADAYSDEGSYDEALAAYEASLNSQRQEEATRQLARAMGYRIGGDDVVEEGVGEPEDDSEIYQAKLRFMMGDVEGFTPEDHPDFDHLAAMHGTLQAKVYCFADHAMSTLSEDHGLINRLLQDAFGLLPSEYRMRAFRAMYDNLSSEDQARLAQNGF